MLLVSVRLESQGAPLSGTRTLIVPALAGLALALSGCGSGSVAAGEVEDKVEQLLADQGVSVATLECPDDLPAEEGEETRCTYQVEQVEGLNIGVTVTVAGVEDGTANMQIQVDDGPLSVDADKVAEVGTTQLGSQVGNIEDLSCPEDLPAEVDAEITCTLTADGEEHDVTVRTTSVEGTTVNFDFQVA